MARTKQRAVVNQRKAVLDLYDGGHSLAHISKITGHKVETVEAMLKRAGVVVDESRKTKPEEAYQMTFSNKRFDLEELLGRVEDYAVLFEDDTPEQTRERHEATMQRLCERGDVDQYARDCGISYQDAYTELSHKTSAVRHGHKVQKAERELEENRERFYREEL